MYFCNFILCYELFCNLKLDVRRINKPREQEAIVEETWTARLCNRSPMLLVIPPFRLYQLQLTRLGSSPHHLLHHQSQELSSLLSSLQCLQSQPETITEQYVFDLNRITFCIGVIRQQTTEWHVMISSVKCERQAPTTCHYTEWVRVNA